MESKNNYDYDKILQAILDVGEELTVCGAEVSRVEDSITRMCESYGMDRVNVFTITSNIQVTVEAPDGKILTHIRKVVRTRGDFDRLDYLNDLSRKIVNEIPSHDIIQQELEKVMERPKQPLIWKVIGYMLMAGSFTIFFGGSYLDCLVSSLMGIVAVVLEIKLGAIEKNAIAYNFVTAFIVGAIAHLLVNIGLGHDVGHVIIGGIMVLIPGVAFTNSVRDIFGGDIISGSLRLINVLLVTVALSFGFGLSMIVFGGVLW